MVRRRGPPRPRLRGLHINGRALCDQDSGHRREQGSAQTCGSRGGGARGGRPEQLRAFLDSRSLDFPGDRSLGPRHDHDHAAGSAADGLVGEGDPRDPAAGHGVLHRLLSGVGVACRQVRHRAPVADLAELRSDWLSQDVNLPWSATATCGSGKRWLVRQWGMAAPGSAARPWVDSTTTLDPARSRCSLALVTTTRFQGVAWQPPAPSTAPPRPTDSRTLPALTLLPLPGAGPEHVAVDSAGRLVTGLNDGRIIRIDPHDLGADGAPARMEVVADTGGRPLGLEFDADGTLVVCDAERGLLRVSFPPESSPDEAPAITVLCDEVDGRPLVFASCPAIAGDGTIYFSQSSQRYDFDHYKSDLLEHSGTGRVLRHRDGLTEVIAEGLQFANGLVLCDDESTLVVAETAAYRVTRFALEAGRVAGTSTLIDSLPGFPDNLTIGSGGLIWIGMASPRDQLLDALLPRTPLLRSLISALPDRLKPGPKNMAWALAIDLSGRIVHDLRGWDVGFREVTAARESGTKLYLAGLDGSALAALDLP